ncbi:DsrE family protein [Thiomicrorhabdus sediminis]|uniref:Uncharacterized protein n=1 Tax=Thiomicrorhabdus sediminis TaxID=2580412 RepID=A0A4P9K3Y4_9GAMM|nr:DsrE family protein [Thiomicrorhabdus sediminis]QCU89170.1 hypothetical protein FE785_00285 [Thiomicrorhabdus sediminis]
MLKIKNCIVLLLGIFMLNTAIAEVPEPTIPDTFAKNKVVLQISDRDPFKQTLVLNVANNLMKHYGADLDIEIVAFGPGVRLLLDGNVNTKRIKPMMEAGVRFSACANTLGNFGKKLGKKPDVMEGATIVPAGAARILQLNAAGWQVLKP